MSGEEMAQAHVVFHGRVQGVYFRAHCEDEANRLGIKGWVANKPDGSVEGLFEGKRTDVESLIEYCKRGQPHARVSECDVRWNRSTGKFHDFRITG
jgi:acylphosphatase